MTMCREVEKALSGASVSEIEIPGGIPITVYEDQTGEGLNVDHLLEHPLNGVGEGARPSHVVTFGATFLEARGQLREDDKVVLASPHVCSLGDLPAQGFLRGKLQYINSLARQASRDGSLYEDRQFCRNYVAAAVRVYRQLAESAEENGFVPPSEMIFMNKLSMWRAGPVSARMWMGVRPDATLPNEYGINVKRAHFTVDRKGDMNVLVYLPENGRLDDLNGNPLLIADWALATGASNIAVLAALRSRGIVPSTVHLRPGVFAPKAVMYMLKAAQQIGIDQMDVLGAGVGSLNDKYYLYDLAIGDAGDIFAGAEVVPDQSICN